MRYGLYSVPIIPNRQHPQPPGGLAILGKGAYKLCLVSECLECYRYSQKSSLGPVCCRKKLESRLSVRLIMLSLANSTRVHPWSELHSVSIVQEKLLCCLSCMFCVYFRMFRGPTLLGWWWGGTSRHDGSLRFTAPLLAASIFGCWPLAVELPATGGYVSTVSSDLLHSTQRRSSCILNHIVTFGSSDIFMFTHCL